MSEPPADTPFPRRGIRLPVSEPSRESFEKRLRSVLFLAFQYVLVAAGLLATSLASAFLTFSLAIRGNEVTVPDLGGSSLPAAGQLLAQSELNLKPEGQRHDERVPAERIMGQEPPPGTMLKKGRSVRVWLSLGPPRRTVPRVEGEALRAAQLILEQNGFVLGRVSEVSSQQYSPDTVIAQDPPPYGEAGESAEVALLLSRGYPGDAYVMPDFIGKEISEVLDRVRAGNLRISSIRYLEYPEVKKGLVVRQTPAAGVKVFSRDSIVLYVSKGS